MTPSEPRGAPFAEPPRRPSRWLMALEGRALVELGHFYRVQPLLAALTPAGDGHVVLVLPGMLATDRSTAPLRTFLRGKGYDAQGWHLGRNLGPGFEVQVGMVRRLHDLAAGSGGKVSIVGWSLGGIYARELAKRHPDLTRSVVTLGSPFAGGPRSTNVGGLYESVTGPEAATRGDRTWRSHLRHAPTVPCTAIYSRSDGIVSWRACLEPETPHTENIRVPGAHCGLGHNAWAVFAIADRLGQDPDDWRPFSSTGWPSLLYPPHE